MVVKLRWLEEKETISRQRNKLCYELGKTQATGGIAIAKINFIPVVYMLLALCHWQYMLMTDKLQLAR